MKLKQWHKDVCERDGYVCQGCGGDFSYDAYFDDVGRNQYVCGHHKDTQGAHPESKTDVDNGVCVCSPCHVKIHTGELSI